MFYTLIKHGFSTNQSALTVVYILQSGVDPGICVTSFHQNKFVQK